MALCLRDRVEVQLPEVGWLVCEDAETGELVELDTNHAAVRHAFEVARVAREAGLKETFRRAGVDAVVCESGSGYRRALLQFFEQRLRHGPLAGLGLGSAGDG
jgi:hypothetical protein